MAPDAPQDPPKTSPDAFNRLVHDEMAFAAYLGIRAEKIGLGTATVRLPYRADLVRLGGAVSGPAIMALADSAMYAVVMSIDEAGAQALTSSMHTHFLRGAFGCDIVAEARMLKGGRRLVICEVFVYAEGEAEAIAHVTGTYARAPSEAADRIAR
jgi:uncharacterized protein (TIGR00369 family)